MSGGSTDTVCQVLCKLVKLPWRSSKKWVCNISLKEISVCVSACVCALNISADQDQTDLRFSTRLLRGSRVCNVRFVWTTMLINYFMNALPILLALSTIGTIVTCAPEPVTAELTPTSYLKKQLDLYLQRRYVWPAMKNVLNLRLIYRNTCFLWAQH